MNAGTNREQHGEKRVGVGRRVTLGFSERGRFVHPGVPVREHQCGGNEKQTLKSGIPANSWL